ncbi:MAG TPA: dihydrofolate reductase, partial [Flavobacteriales bacterium]|nr:dihydrofolate reductase [Flavobacteriales bacterium]
MKHSILLIGALVVFTASCTTTTSEDSSATETDLIATVEDDFKYMSEKFADIKILRYKIPGFKELDLKKKKLLYFLYQAAHSGRDIIYDQNYKHNLYIKRTLEAIANSYSGDKTTEAYGKFSDFAKRVWFSNGIHHHYSSAKIEPEFSKEYFAELVNG